MSRVVALAVLIAALLAPTTATASPAVYRHLKPRRHVVKVRAFSPIAGDQTPAKRRFRVKPPVRSRGAARR